MTRTCRSNSHDAHGRRLAGDTPETGSRLAALLVTIGLLGVLFLVAVLWQTWKWSKEQTEQAARQQAQMALAFDDAIRKHIATHVRPAMEKRMVPGATRARFSR